MFAAVIATAVWYTHTRSSELKVGMLCWMFWGASLMWLVDAIFEFVELKEAFFNQPFADLLNDSILGLCAVALGLIAWLVVVFIKDPKGLFKKSK